MNAISTALREISFKIPRELLEITFNRNEGYYTHNITTLDEKIMNAVIRPRVLIDANIVGGVSLIIALQGMVPAEYDPYNTVYYIPPESIGYRNIISVLSAVMFPYGLVSSGGNTNYNYFAQNGLNSVVDAMGRVYDSVANVAIISNATPMLIGTNTVLIKENYRVVSSYGLKCVVDNETNLQNINPRSHLAFANLCVLAVKSYIYNKLIVKTGKAYLESGQELGEIRNLIDEYRDAEEQYSLYLNEKWRPVSYMNDIPNYNKFIKSMVNPGL